MVKKILFGVIAIFLLIQVVSAYQTQIQIKTIPDREVQVIASKPSSSSFEAIGNPMKGISDQYGDVTIIFDSDAAVFNLIVNVKKNGEKVMPPRKFEDGFSAGDKIYLEVVPEGFEIIETPVNETIEENQTVVENVTGNLAIEETDSNNTSKGVTGSVIFTADGSLSPWLKYTLYILGILIILLTIAFVVLRILKNRREPKEIRVRKLSEINNERQERIDDNKAVIEDAERKIREAQEELRALKNQDRIKDVKRKIEEDERELLRLRRGEE